MKGGLKMKTGYPVSDCMTQDPISTESTTTIKDCAKLMEKYNLGSIVVVDNEKLIGVVTHQDLVFRGIAKGIKPNSQINEIMSKNVMFISPKIDIFEALEVMNQNSIRHISVVNKGKLVGYLTLKDILKIEPALFDLYVDKIRLREEHNKPIPHYEDEGICESCGNYSRMLEEFDGQLICSDCKENKEE